MITGTMENEQDRVRLCQSASKLMQYGVYQMKWVLDEDLPSYGFVFNEEGIRFGRIAHERWIDFINNKPPESHEEIK